MKFYENKEFYCLNRDVRLKAYSKVSLDERWEYPWANYLKINSYKFQSKITNMFQIEKNSFGMSKMANIRISMYNNYNKTIVEIENTRIDKKFWTCIEDNNLLNPFDIRVNLSFLDGEDRLLHFPCVLTIIPMPRHSVSWFDVGAQKTCVPVQIKVSEIIYESERFFLKIYPLFFTTFTNLDLTQDSVFLLNFTGEKCFTCFYLSILNLY